MKALGIGSVGNQRTMHYSALLSILCVRDAACSQSYFFICQKKEAGYQKSRSSYGPAQSPPRCTKCNTQPINGQCTNFILFDVAL